MVHVMTRIVYGTAEQVEAALRASPVSYTINTYGEERHNLTLRQHSHRLGCKVNASRKTQTTCKSSLCWPSPTTTLWCHTESAATPAMPVPMKCCHGSYKKWKAVTPAMAAGATDYVLPMAEMRSALYATQAFMVMTE